MTSEARSAGGARERLLPPREAAKVLGVSYRTLYNWVLKGYIKPVKLPSGRFRYPEDEVMRILREKKAE